MPQLPHNSPGWDGAPLLMAKADTFLVGSLFPQSGHSIRVELRTSSSKSFPHLLQ